MSVSAWRGRLRGATRFLAVLAIAFPLLRLWPLDGIFAVDWVNHTWLASYSGEYLRQHGTVPVVVNTVGQAGMAYPVFYGSLFYPLLAVLTTWMNPALVIRIVCVAVTALQFSLVVRALCRIDVPRFAARSVACLTIWAIYPLTNLYHRSALTEYVAAALLTCVVASWFLLIYAQSNEERRRRGHSIGLMLVLIAGTHPITALYAIPIFALLLVVTWQLQGHRRAFWFGLTRCLALPAILAGVTLLQWLYALHLYKDRLQVAVDGGPFFYAGIDDWLTRWSPLPSDPRVVNAALDGVSSPYLDAQLNVPLLLILAVLVTAISLRATRERRAVLRVVAAPVAAFAFFVWISLTPSAFELLPNAARMLQLAYRAITYQNLSLFIAILVAAEAARRSRAIVFQKRVVLASIVVCLLLSAAGVVSKLHRADAIMSHRGSPGLFTSTNARAQWSQLPVEFYGYNGYATTSFYRRLRPEDGRYEQVWMPVGTGKDFGVVQALPVDLASDTWVATNIQAFPWNHIGIDGLEVPARMLRVEGVRLAVRVPAGHHVLTMTTIPRTIWRLLRALSFAVLAAWAGFLVFLYLRAWRHRKSSPL